MPELFSSDSGNCNNGKILCTDIRRGGGGGGLYPPPIFGERSLPLYVVIISKIAG